MSKGVGNIYENFANKYIIKALRGINKNKLCINAFEADGTLPSPSLFISSVVLKLNKIVIMNSTVIANKRPISGMSINEEITFQLIPIFFK